MHENEVNPLFSAHCLFYLKNKNLNALIADSSSKFNEAVDKLFQYKWCQHLYLVLTAYSAWKKKQIFSVFTADPSGSFSEVVDKLFQHLWFKNA